MLVLSRKVGEQIVVGGNVTITVVKIVGNTIRIGIDAPSEMPIVRRELLLATEDKGDAVTMDSPAPSTE